MEVKFDREVSAMYVQLSHEAVARTVEMPTAGMGLMLNVDIDVDGRAVGVEII